MTKLEELKASYVAAKAAYDAELKKTKEQTNGEKQ